MARAIILDADGMLFVLDIYSAPTQNVLAFDSLLKPTDESPSREMNKKQTWVRADKLQPGDRIQDANGNIVTIKEATKGIFPGSILITLQDADPDFVYLEPDTKIFVE